MVSGHDIYYFFGCSERYFRRILTDSMDVLKIKIELPANVKDLRCHFIAVTISKETLYNSGCRERIFAPRQNLRREEPCPKGDRVREPAFPEHPL